MLHRYLGIGLLLTGLAGESVLLMALITGSTLATTPLDWLSLHAVASITAACGTTLLLSSACGTTLLLSSAGLRNRLPLFAWLLALGITLPFAGAAGAAIALLNALRLDRGRDRETDWWQVTRNAELPYTTPIGRQATALDGRGLQEQLLHSANSDELYQKVLSMRQVPAAIAVQTLKPAIAHSDERIRLTAYQMLDKRVNGLNREIQRLEAKTATNNSTEQADTWLQIAANYWELLTLEKDEPVARRQLLHKAETAAENAIKIQPEHRNAHFNLGRTRLLQGHNKGACIAFERSMALGMPREKVVPYLAEASFGQRDFTRVAELLGSLDQAFTRYPPLCHVAQYWR